MHQAEGGQCPVGEAAHAQQRAVSGLPEMLVSLQRGHHLQAGAHQLDDGLSQQAPRLTGEHGLPTVVLHEQHGNCPQVSHR